MNDNDLIQETENILKVQYLEPDYWMMLIKELNSRFLNVTVGFLRDKCFCDIKRIDYPVPMDSWYAEDKTPGKAVCLATLKYLEKNKLNA